MKKPRMLNRICAHPEAVSCALGACTFDALLLGWLPTAARLQDIAPNWQWVLYFVAVAFPAGSLLGCLLGMFAFWPVIRVVCSRINGAPLRPGDQVVVLSGPHKGTIAEVYETTRGQGGWDLARLDLGAERKERFRDIFEEYSLLAIRRGEQYGAVNGSQPDETGGMKPRMLNRICAYPDIVGWTPCACAAATLLICWLFHQLPFSTVVGGLVGCLLVDMFTWPLFRGVCSRINGAPFKVGDRVMVLSGPYRGAVTEVDEIILNPCGWSLAVLDIDGHKQLLDQWSLLRIRQG